MTRSALRPLPQPPYQLLEGASLFVDFDGTLVEIAARPDAVLVGQDLIRLLNRLACALRGRLVVVSGRALADVSALLGGAHISIVGSHGAELRLSDGREQSLVRRDPPENVLKSLQSLAASEAGVLIETKPLGLAIHYRLAPHAAEKCMTLAGEIAAAEGYGLQPGKMVIELKYHRMTKGDAVRKLMDMAPMSSGLPLFVGDDLTDEVGFEAAEELGGAGILIGPERPTHALYRLVDVPSALRWLDLAMEFAA